MNLKKIELIFKFSKDSLSLNPFNRNSLILCGSENFGHLYVVLQGLKLRILPLYGLANLRETYYIEMHKCSSQTLMRKQWVVGFIYRIY